MDLTNPMTKELSPEDAQRLRESIPDFVRLSPADAVREDERLGRLRQEFNSRARLTSAQIEAGRAEILIPTLAEAVKTSPKAAERKRLKSQLAEAYAAQGYFLKAAEVTSDKKEKAFYQKAADAIFNQGGECECSGALASIGRDQIRLPKHRIIREVNSLPAGTFGYLVECNGCGGWYFSTVNPLPEQIDPKDFVPGKMPNDLVTLKA